MEIIWVGLLVTALKEESHFKHLMHYLYVLSLKMNDVKQNNSIEKM